MSSESQQGSFFLKVVLPVALAVALFIVLARLALRDENKTVHIYNETSRRVTVNIGYQRATVRPQEFQTLKGGFSPSTLVQATSQGTPVEEMRVGDADGFTMIYNVAGAGALCLVDYTNCYRSGRLNPEDLQVVANLSGRKLYMVPFRKVYDSGEPLPAAIQLGEQVLRIERVPPLLTGAALHAYLVDRARHEPATAAR
ncbi:MAG TPA: hypothetical protein VNO81_04200 [Candidatus Nitrosotenuis sp.]|jgi:hypothetical protein|nr:hypothetical protein [Candidatus Nitrosotenuis sp.]